MLLFRLLSRKSRVWRARVCIYSAYFVNSNSSSLAFSHLTTDHITLYRWLVPSKLLANLLVARRPVNSWRPSLPSRPLVKLQWVSGLVLLVLLLKLLYRLLLVVWRNPIVLGPELSLFVKFVVTKSQRSCLFVNFLSNGLFVRLLRISRYAFNHDSCLAIGLLLVV